MSAYLTSRPAAGRIVEGFGPRENPPTPTSPTTHYGQDYGWVVSGSATAESDPIYAARDGVVLDYAYSGAYGNRTRVDHGDGRETWYCHQLRNTVPRGAQVRAGQQIGWMGSTGNSTAKHLHFELRIDGVAVDPEPYFADGATAGGDLTPIDEEEDDDMVIIIKGSKTGDSYPYVFDPVTQTRTASDPARLSLMRAQAGVPGGKPVPEVVMDQATFDAIPKAPGSK